jgi:DNA-binding NarL/FixJ family response regulator
VSTQERSPSRILIADDQKRARQGLKALLAAQWPGVQIREASDGAEAVRLAEESQPTLVVMDVRMPGMDGITATRILKTRWPSIRVLALSLDPDREAEARAAGADLFVAKGESPERLLWAVSSLL